MPQYHVWRRKRNEVGFTKIGDFANGDNHDAAARDAEGSAAIEPGAVYFVEPTDGVTSAMLLRARVDTVALEPIGIS